MMSTGDLIALLAERGIAGINLGAIILWPETILMPQDAPQEVIDQLTKDGVLRAGINMANGLLVTGKAANGDPQGVSPDLARAMVSLACSRLWAESMLPAAMPCRCRKAS